MIDVKTAIQIAKDHAKDLFDGASVGVEEFERESYDGRPVWVITLSLPKRQAADSADAPPGALGPLSRLMNPSTEFKRFFVDEESGKILAMKIREFAYR